MNEIIPENINEIEIGDGVTFKYDYMSKAGKVIEIQKNAIIAVNAVGVKYTVKFEKVDGLYKGYYKKKEGEKST